MEQKHLLTNSSFESIPFKSTSFTSDWIRSLVGKMGMDILYAPRSVMCDKKGNEGISSFCLITTSHLCLHTRDSLNLLQLDVYSYKDFDIDLVLEEINKFKPLSLKYKVINRDNF
jgi:S-adenosylmethionine/arginine decarboxylase-like enzyme